MKTLSHNDRQSALEAMATNPVDLLIIGGGITGAAVAIEAALSGYSVGLIEKGDFASGTSSKSTKLAHGGIRYLPQMDFGLVHEALVERGRLFQNVPWLVQPMSFVLPLYEWSKRPLGVPFALPGGIGLSAMIDCGLGLYDLLAGKRNVKRHSRLSLSETRHLAPSLSVQGLSTAFAYYDGSTDDVRLTLTFLRSAAAAGAQIANYAEALGFELEEGIIRAARIRDTINGREYVIKATQIVNATGVYSARMETLGGSNSQMAISPSKGVHLLVSREALPVSDSAIVLPETDDGRLMFIIPWRHHVLIGTTDTEGGDIELPATTSDDVDYLLAHCNRYLTVCLGRDDIISTMAGYRPLIKRTDKAARALSRSHVLHADPSGMITITGGKLTTCRQMAEETVAKLSRIAGRPFTSQTHTVNLDGREGWPVDWSQFSSNNLSDALKQHLETSYGGNAREIVRIMSENTKMGERIVADLPYLMAEVVYACRYEQAMTLEDILERRTRIALETRDHGIGLAPKVAALMAATLGWSESRRDLEIATYTEHVPIRYGVIAGVNRERRLDKNQTYL